MARREREPLNDVGTHDEPIAGVYPYDVERTQHDKKQDFYSDLTALRCPPEEDQTRQEFKQEADINYLLNRFGVDTGRPITYGEIDYTLELQGAIQAVREADIFLEQIPKEIRDKLGGTRQAMLDAIADGRMAAELTDLKKRQEKAEADRIQHDKEMAERVSEREQAIQDLIEQNRSKKRTPT